MLIYEKNNKLNISFENNMDETDIVVGKDEISVDGNNIVNSGGMFEITATGFQEGATLDKTYSEIVSAISSGKIPMVKYLNSYSILLNYYHSDTYNVKFYNNANVDGYLFTSNTEDGTLTFNSKL